MFKKNKKIAQEVPAPAHVGIIMDGNGRWAKNQGKPRIFGHKAGMDRLKDTAIYGQKQGIKVMTVYAFSTENWTRPIDEVKFIMSLPIDFYGKYVPILKAENIQIRMIGERKGLPDATLKAIDKAALDTAENTGMILTFAMNYGGRADILLAVQDIIKQGYKADEVTEDLISEHLQTSILPADLRDPDLIIRTSGELRLSNFLPWQTAYSELYFTDVPWPDFNEEQLDLAIETYQKRDRRYGGVKS